MAADVVVSLLSAKRRKELSVLLFTYLYSAPAGAEYRRRES